MLTTHALEQLVLLLRCLDPDSCSTPSDIPHPVLVGLPGSQPAGTLRGDWESPEILVMAFNESWPSARDAIVETATRSTDVWVVLEEGHRRSDAKAWRRRLSPEVRERVRILDVRVDSPWVRDYGPLQIRDRDGSTRWLDATYAGSRPMDDAVPLRLANLVDAWVEPLSVSIDGGAIASNGRGLCATTAEYLDGEDIRPERYDVMQPLLLQLGCRGLAILPALEHEATTHVDPFVQFLSPSVVAVASFDPDDAPGDYERTELSAIALQRAAAALGQKIQIVRVPTHLVKKAYYTYINGLRLPDAYLVPTFDNVPSELEEAAHAALAAAMPGLELVQVPGDRLVDHEGVVHCATLGLGLPIEVQVEDEDDPVVAFAAEQ